MWMGDRNLSYLYNMSPGSNSCLQQADDTLSVFLFLINAK